VSEEQNSQTSVKVRCVIACVPAGHRKYLVAAPEPLTLNRVYCPGCRAHRRFEVVPSSEISPLHNEVL
jgi:hypothetical protein